MIRPTVVLILSVLLSGCSGVNRLDFTSWGRAIWQRPEDVDREMREAGFRRLESIDLLPTQIFEVFGRGP